MSQQRAVFVRTKSKESGNASSDELPYERYANAPKEPAPAPQDSWEQSGLFADFTDPLYVEPAKDTHVQAKTSPDAVDTLWGDEESDGAPTTRTNSLDAWSLWRKTLGELQLQLASSTYYTWLHNTWVEAYEDGDLIIGTANTYARDWLDNRLKNVIRRTLKSIAGRTMDVRFIVSKRTHDPRDRYADLRSAPPTLHTAEREQEFEASNFASSSLGASSFDAPEYGTSNLDVQEQSAHASIEEIFADTSLNAQALRAMPATPRVSQAEARLNPQYSFESFVVGSNNRLACAAAQAVAERPGYKFNPLFVHGGVGLGKTHLLHAIGNALATRGLNVLYVTSEQFTNDLITAIRAQNTDLFRNRYRALDVLLIDDIQFIAGKESTQEEVFHTFNHLQHSGKQIVLSSDRPPRLLQPLEERLRSRFEGGIRVDVSAPDYETRVAILQSKAQRMGIHVEAEVLNLVAQRVDSNIRELEGALNHLFLQAQMARTQLDMTLATNSLDRVAPHRKPCTPDRLIEVVAQHQHLTAADLTGSRRTKPVADARHIAMYLLREDSGLSLPQIGALFGGRDHTTVAHGVSKITDALRNNEQLRVTVATLRERIYTAG